MASTSNALYVVHQVFRTWVKYVEKGEFPNTRNHCENAPCVEICPTKALFKRPNGIVDFDKW